MTPHPACSIVIPSYNGKPFLERCLRSIYRHWPRTTIEIIVVDDASTDGTAAWLKRAGLTVRLIRLETNGGFCAAANAGIAAARGAVVQLLNNDTEVRPGWIEAGLAPFADPTVGSVAPLVLVRSEPDRVDSAGDQYSLVGWPSKRGHGQPTSRWVNHPPDRVFGASGSSAFFRVDALRRVGGFDPSFGSYYEDVDLAFRLRWAGYECGFEPRCQILHDVSATYDHADPRLQERMSRNAEVLFWSNLPARWLICAALPHSVFTLAQVVHRVLQNRHRPFLRGKLAAAGQWTTLGSRRQVRADLARGALRPARFPIRLGLWEDVANHLHRPSGAGRPG